jgi:hypothetical protein
LLTRCVKAQSWVSRPQEGVPVDLDELKKLQQAGLIQKLSEAARQALNNARYKMEHMIPGPTLERQVKELGELLAKAVDINRELERRSGPPPRAVPPAKSGN